MGNNSCFSLEELFELFIDTIINPNLEDYISNEIKDEVCKYIINTFYFKLKTENKFDFLLKIESMEIINKLILINQEYFPDLKFSDFFSLEENTAFINLTYFIEKGILKHSEFENNKFVRDLIDECNSEQKKLENKEINFSQVNKLKELIQKKKLQKRIFNICLGDSKKSQEIEKEVERYTDKYITYYENIDILLRYYNKYYPNSKKDEINKYYKQQMNFKEKTINICDIELNEKIYEEITIFEKYEKSKLFNIFYNIIELNKGDLEKELNDEELKKKQEVLKFNKAIEIFNKCEKLFNGENFELDFLEIPLNKLEDNDTGENLLKEINYLKNNFGYKDSDENEITKNLMLYKNRNNISNALLSLKNLCQKINVYDMEKIGSEIEILAEKIRTVKKYLDIPKYIDNIIKIDQHFFEKNFLDILLNFYQNEKLIIFLNGREEAQTRDLIDGLFDENEDNCMIELNDITILVNVVCFFQELISKTGNIQEFLNNFHSILQDKNHLYKDIISNIVHIHNKIDLLQDFIKIQLGKNYKFSTNIEYFMNSGIIQIIKKPMSFEQILKDLNSLNIQFLQHDYYFDAVIIIDNKEESFEVFMETIKRIRAKNLFRYGKNKEIFLKAKKIAELIQAILKELNYDRKQEIKEEFKEFKVCDLKFEDKGSLKLPKLEGILNHLRYNNESKKMFELIFAASNPYLMKKMIIDTFESIDFEELRTIEKIKNYFPNIQEVENNFHNLMKQQCNGCNKNPTNGILYKCKECPDFYYCKNCFSINKEKHNHEFEKMEHNQELPQIDLPKNIERIPDFILKFFGENQIQSEYSLKGLFFLESTKRDYEIEIMKLFKELLKPSRSVNPDKLPFYYNLLLCHDNPKDEVIYSFCIRAVNCTTNNLFIIVRPEDFTRSQKKFFLKTITKLLERNHQIESCIIVLSLNSNEYIIKQLKSLKKKYEYKKEPDLFDNLEKLPLPNLEYLPIEIVTSDSPRVGKTHYINEKIKKEFGECEIFYFPLGDVDSIYLRKKIVELGGLKNRKLSIIFELYENFDENVYFLIKFFIFIYLILEYDEMCNHEVKKNMQIFFEVSSDYINYDQDFKYLKSFKKHHIKFKNDRNFYKNNPIIPKKNSTNQILQFFTSYSNVLSNSEKMLPNFGQIEMFCDLLNYLIDNMNQNKEINNQDFIIKANKYPFLNTIKQNLIPSYVEFIIKFTTFSYESILENQELASKHQKQLITELKYEEKKKLLSAINKKRDIIAYDDISPGIILFNNFPDKEEYNSLSKCTILTTIKGGEKFEELEKFYKYITHLHLFNLFDFSESNFRTELKNICLTPFYKKNTQKKQKEPSDSKVDDTEDLNLDEINIQLAKKGYVFTIDNFIKMVLIYLRIKANVPVILLGETGCGKTFLIEALIFFLEDRYELIKLDIHAGINYEEITRFFKENNLFENGYKKQKSTILLLDEINTTNSINLLSDIFTKHSFNGNPLKNNVFIIGTCNPYRLTLLNTEEIGYKNKKMHRVRNLVYTVNPLPSRLINYIFDFGNIKEKDEKEYISTFVNRFLSDNFASGNAENYTKIFCMINDAVFETQKYIRNKSEISSVSLREIKRFIIFFDFFFKLTKEREFKDSDFNIVLDKDIFSKTTKPEEQKEVLIALKAVSASIFICFYLRIYDSEKRKALAELIQSILKIKFLDYPYQLEDELFNNLEKNKGIAKNRALLDNLFTLFVCLIQKIPIFICGKAGCSKSLSFSLLYQSMKGQYSKSKLFKKYPSIYLTSYQGSLTSNPKEIKKIFEIAKKKIAIQKNSKNKSLSVILFDEMGLAEISPYNPLKVIHSELDGKQDVCFVGISNWTLDASKMNRVIHLSVQEPDEKDLIKTANTIAKDIYEEADKNSSFNNLIKNLTKSYFDYKIHLKKYYASDYDFHGLRDFYNLIKITANALKNNDDKKSLESIAMCSIERNFGGLELVKDGKAFSSTKKYKEIFSDHQKIFMDNLDKYDVFSCIKNNIENDNNRYLLLITNKTKNEILIEFILKKINKTYRFIQGSKLEEDQNEDYVLDKTWSIINFMEKGQIIILKDLEIIYPKFYDLFNQNFQIFGDSQYARIVLDSTNNERHIVNKNFRCIVLLEQKDIEEQDPPFLNRFEKHLVSFTYLLTENQNNLANELYNEIKELTVIPEINNMLPFLVNINIEEIRSLILDLSSKYNDNIETHLSEIYELLIPTFSQENVLNAVFSPKKKYIKREDIIKIYEENSHTNIYTFLEKVKKIK